MDLLDQMRPYVDRTIDSLAGKSFRVDPIGGERYSRATSIVSSAYKRHGQIIEEALLRRLSDCRYFTVWKEPNFRVSSVADHAIRARNAEVSEALPMDLPYDGTGRRLQLDFVLFDKRIDSLRAYEVKRGNGQFDAGKTRSILTDLLCTQALLRSYGQKKGYKASIAKARLISYYGVRALPNPLNIFGTDLDDHFVFTVYGPVERVNEYFRERIYELLDEVTGLTELEKASLCDACLLIERIRPN